MRNLVITLLLAMAFVTTNAQSLSKGEWNSIQASGDYLIGAGTGGSVEEARDSALDELSKKVVENVKPQFEYDYRNLDKKKGPSFDEIVKGVVNSYIYASVEGIKEYMERKDGRYTIYSFMKREYTRSMFKERVGVAKKWVEEAVEMEKEGKVGDAIQGFYWSLALLKTCPNADLETITLDKVTSNMITEVNKRVQGIISAISIQAIAMERSNGMQRLTLSVLYKSRPAINFSYRYNEGKQYSFASSAKDGIGELLMPQSTRLNKLKVMVDYECKDVANIHPDLRAVMQYSEPFSLSTEELLVDAKDYVTMREDSYAIKVGENNQIDEDMMISSLSEKDMEPFINTIQHIERAITQKSFDAIKELFTTEGWSMFNSLINYGDAKLLSAPSVQFLPDGDGGVVCRSFPMSFSFKGNRRTFKEDVVFYLDGNAKVKEVAFGLEQAAVKDIMQRGAWNQEAREIMVHFLETYKTAYALKRTDYISSIFSDDALIITGSIVKRTGHKEIGPTNMQYVKYTRQTKEQYIKNLRKCFDSNEYVNIHFADNIVRRSGTNPNIYGIQIKQDYYSSNYGDTGYLFLLIDFSNPDEPLIHVRAWQPDKDPNIKDGRISIADFIL